jgi:hypothetical protein
MQEIRANRYNKHYQDVVLELYKLNTWVPQEVHDKVDRAISKAMDF